MQSLVDGAERAADCSRASVARAAAAAALSGGNDAVLVLTDRAALSACLRRLGLRPRGEPRAAHRGLLFAPMRFGGGGGGGARTEVLVAMRRRCDYLRPPELLVSARELTLVGADRGESCTARCGREGRRCDRGELLFPAARSCAALRAAFGCKVCGHQVGTELPAFVPLGGE